MNFKFFLISLFLFGIQGVSQTYSKQKTNPKLVVGIVVDQMRYDYLTRFADQYGEGGFKKMMRDGFSCKNHHFNYIPTTTAPGHASIFTGTTPQNHGILGNSWYDKVEKQKVYCVEDPKVSPLGTGSPQGRKSPHRMLTTTIGDQNRLHTQKVGKTIGISIKDRAAILSAGSAANAAYWFRGTKLGSWISSSFYMKKLPKWVVNFNASTIADQYFKKWEPLYNIASYKQSGADSTTFERGFRGKEKAVFSYDLAVLRAENGDYNILRSTPYGNSLTVDFAIAALKGERLGKDAHTDVLTISFSSTDYIGHNFGVNSKEIQDTYLRLDKDLERLFNTLDKEIGNQAYTVFLTADHGATQVPGYLKSLKIPSSYFKEASFNRNVKNYVKNYYRSDSLVTHISNNQLYLNKERIIANNIDFDQVQDVIAAYILQHNAIDKVFTRSQLEGTNFTSGTASLIQHGFHQKRSGDIFYVLNPATIAYSKTGSTHGSGFSYDTHVPLLFYGKGINKGRLLQRTHVTDIAPTICALLGITAPNGTTGTIISQVID